MATVVCLDDVSLFQASSAVFHSMVVAVGAVHRVGCELTKVTKLVYHTITDQYHYLRQRYYDTETGRFTRRDTYEGTLEDPMSLHKYLYAHANPVNYIDPSGLSTTTIGDLTSLIAAISALVAIYWAAPTIKLATEESINNFLDLYVPYFASQRGHQGNQGDTGILEEARGLIGETGSNGKIIQTMEEALTELMREAKKNKDNAKIKRIEKTQKAIKNRNKSKRNEY